MLSALRTLQAARLPFLAAMRFAARVLAIVMGLVLVAGVMLIGAVSQFIAGGAAKGGFGALESRRICIQTRALP